MLTRKLVFMVLAGLPLLGFAQGSSIELYPYNYTSISPAFAGVDGTRFTFIGNALFGSGAPYAGFLSGETSYENVGFGFTTSGWRLGPQHIFEYALPVNYQWKINEKNMLVFGARMSYQRDVLDFSVWVALDPNDPLLNAPDRVVSSVANISLGALYKSDLLYAGFSVDNLLTKEKQNEFGGLPTKYNFIVGKDVKGNGKLSSMHSVYTSIVGKSWVFDVNNAVIFNDLIIAGFSIAFTDQEEVIPKINAGVQFGEYGKAVVMLYSKNNDVGYKDFSGQLFLMFTLPAL